MTGDSLNVRGGSGIQTLVNYGKRNLNDDGEAADRRL
jgi:hypothetical protein